MEKPLFSPSWYRIAKLKPRLRAHSEIHRHMYRGEKWFVMQDHSTGKFYRFSPMAYYIIGLMDGKRTVQELWELAAEKFGDDSPTQDDVIRLFRQLHVGDMLLCDVPPNTQELLLRGKKIDRARWLANLRSPLFLRFPLFDPENFLTKTMFLTRPFFSIFGIILWLAVVGYAAMLAGQHWPELTHNITDRVLAAENLLILWFVYPFVKGLHEFGHGYAVRNWGGEVHEMGIMLLVLMPIPYVDASSASAFREKWRRIFIGAAGILTELFVAATAMIVWVSLDPGLPRTIAFNIVLIGSISTILFNANPLLRYDGYYILGDFLDISNLAQRSINYLQYLIKRYFFRASDAEQPYIGPGEKFWLATYSICAFFYRLFIYTAIILFIAGKFFFIGIVLALWACTTMFVFPLFKGIKYIVNSKGLRSRRFQALSITGAALALIFLLFFVLPFPLWTNAEGVIWAPEDSLVRANASGFIRQLKVEPFSRVYRGQVLVECSDDELQTGLLMLRSKQKEFELRYGAALSLDPLQATIIQEELNHIKTALVRTEERVNDLTIRSPADGIFIVPQAVDLPGRFIRHGEMIGYVLESSQPVVRVVIPQINVDLVRQRTNEVLLRFAENFDDITRGTISRELPGALEQLPSITLSTAGGGQIVLDPTSGKQMKTFDKMFQFDIEPEVLRPSILIGARVYAKFHHGYEPLAFQWYRDIRQLFLKRFNV
jgi:putative peptide zinc metalloprotease protein